MEADDLVKDEESAEEVFAVVLVGRRQLFRYDEFVADPQ